MTMAIAHREGDIGVLDCVVERKPKFSPAVVVGEFAQILGSYRISNVTGDRWGGEFVREQFKDRSIAYEISERNKSDIYRELLPLLNSGRTELLDHPKLKTQLCGLERKTARGGRDSVDHAPGAHDDIINAAAGALVLAAGKLNGAEIWARLGAD